MTDEPRRDFGRVARDSMLEQDKFMTALGAPNFQALLLETDIGYESGRKALIGDRFPSNKIIEAVAAVLGFDPEVCWEYRLNTLREKLDPDPEQRFDTAYAAFHEVEEAMQAGAGKRR